MQPRSRGQFGSASAVLIVLGACSLGGGPRVTKVTIPSQIDASVSAGSPVAGATVTVYAMSDATGEVDTTAGTAGVLGSAGPTDESGRVTVLTRPYSGPVQLVASGIGLSYVDPTSPPDAPVHVQIPTSFVLSSFVGKFGAGNVVVPVTLLTTLADHEALAFARGLHPDHPRRTTITESLAARDPLFVNHITRAASWSPGSLRSTAPAALAAGPVSLVDSAYAAMFDLALNQLAHDPAALAAYGTTPSGLSAPVILQLLEADLDADAMLDGKGAGGAPVVLPGSSPVPIDAQFACRPLAVALDSWSRKSSVNRSGIGEGELVAGRVLEALVQDASDLLGSHALGSVTELVDHTPPTVEWGTPPPSAVADSNAVLDVVAADDQTAVAGVFAQVGTGLPTSGALQADGHWTITLALTPGPNVVSVWAVDEAASHNSGQYKPAPYSLAAVVIFGTSAPAVGFNEAFANYRDERGLTVATGVNGLAVVPPRYGYADATPVAIPAAGGHVYKAASRLAWQAAPMAAVLEDPAGNPDNIPALQFWVPYVAGVDTPIASASYSVAVNCAGCAFSAVTGPLWASPATSSGRLYYDLPMSSNLIPALAALPSAATLTVTITVVDVAGHVSTVTPASLTFHTIGDPVGVTEDAGYPAANDPRSTYPYAISSGLYADLFSLNAANYLPEGQVRLVRYLVSNPSSSTVALLLPRSTGGWSIEETWEGSAGVSLGTVSYPVTATTCSTAPLCVSPTPVSYSGGAAGSGCGATPPHGVTPATDAPVATSGDLGTFAYLQAAGADSSPAPHASTGEVLVPPASAVRPGTVALYVGRPVAAPARSYALPWTGSAFKYLVENAWVETWRGAAICCDYDTELRRCLESSAPSTWSGQAFYRTLTSGVDALQGTLPLLTRGTSAGFVIGEPSLAATVTVTRTIAH